jgi:hypothetical protein
MTGIIFVMVVIVVAMPPVVIAVPLVVIAVVLVVASRWYAGDQVVDADVDGDLHGYGLD